MEQSLWAKWCHAYLINSSNFWILPVRGKLSWSWRQTLLLRRLAKDHILYICGNRERFSLWFDPWLQGVSVHALYGQRVIYDTGLGQQVLVKDVIWQGPWCWPLVSGDLLEIQQRMHDIPISSNPYNIYWGSVGHSFSTGRAWHDIRTRSSEVGWYDLVWHPSRILKHAFCLWLDLRGTHRTRDKLLAAGVIQSNQCEFHYGESESLVHLFFQCPYSASIWLAILRMCNISIQCLHWSDEVNWMTGHAKGNNFPAMVRKLAFAAVVYHIWIERNRQIFKNSFLPFQKIVRKVKADVAGKLFMCNKSMENERHHTLCIN
ncbi:zf-RVT domain-containing protein [Cephalotus follicularis]|uniref:Zf-RVT domain-containing protein n=1 Tax=Cephalotus follicularis TaxID=3775 RepID=A0A1Q3AZ29_CEPFO|nr:zf-RVT domain-containing protein [Cephalotus follicularis]